MTAEKFANTLLEKCDIYYGDDLISKEAIIGKYLTFFATSLASKERTVNFSLHTGSLCFDVISIVAVALGCLSYNLTTNDDIISALQTDDMVMYNGRRYRWKGTRQEYGRLCMILEQDGKGRNGKAVSYLPLEKNKHLIKPYYGDSQVTDGRGVRKKKTNREDFLAYAFDVDVKEIPTQIDVSVVIVADRSYFAEMCKHVRIAYGDGKRVSILDLFPAAFYTGSGEEYQFGQNPTKNEPVLKVTGKISTARDLVLERNGNKVVGLLVVSSDAQFADNSELSDLLRRKTLRFIYVTSPLQAETGKVILEQYESASVFACTKNVLSKNDQTIRTSNLLTMELHRQIMNITHNTVTEIPIGQGWSWDEYKNIKNAIFQIKQSNWNDPAKDDFILSAYGLLNLINTAVFPLNVMENAIACNHLNKAIISPWERIQGLWDIADRADSMQELCMMVANALECKYKERLNSCPKANILKSYLDTHKHQNVAIIVPKAYYIDLFYIEYPELQFDEKIICVTPNRFDSHKEYDAILCAGELNNRRFDPLECLAARNIDILLYRCEHTLFTFRQKKYAKYQRKLNQKLGITCVEDEVPEDNPASEKQVEDTIRHFSALDEYMETFNTFDIRKFAQSSSAGNNYAPVSEVKYIGTFVSGEKILFSKFYSAVVFDHMGGGIIEKAPDYLRPGDVLVFTKRDDYTKNIVDFIYEQLLRNGRLGQTAVDSYEKSQYWKEALREYKEVNKLTYRMVARKLRAVGSKVQEVTVRQWLIDDSHIVGPRDEHTMEHIATVTQDPYLLADTHGFFYACKDVRRYRRKILELIAKAINDKLSGNTPEEGSILSIVYDNVGSLSETLELEDVTELDQSINININLVNTPITEAEVLA